MSHTLNRIQGPLVIEGGVGPEDRSVKPGVTLPGELNPDLPEVVINVDESTMTDTLNVYSDSSVSDDTGVMSTLLLHTDYSVKADGTVSATLISGLGMGTDLVVNKGTEAAPDLFTYKGGIAYTNLEVAEVLLGTGNDTFTVTGTRAGTATAVHGGGGADTLIVTGGGGSASPLVLYGDTSEDGSHYTSTGGTPSSSGIHFDTPGADTIDASASSAGVLIYGGPGDDLITGSQGNDQIAGGLGDDTIDGQAGNDIIYGDSGFNTTLSSRTLTVPTTEVPGTDTIEGGAGNDIIFGDHGIVTQAASGLLGTGGVNRIETTNEAAGLGDTIEGGAGDDRIFGGLGADMIEGNADNDTIFGDHGVMDFVSRDGNNATVDLAYTRNTASGSIDTIYGNAGDDTIFGGVGADLLYGGNGSGGAPVVGSDRDTVIGDFGRITFAAGIVSTTETIDPGQGANDTIEGNEDDDILMGGFGSDRIDAGVGNDIVFGDNARVDHGAGGAPRILQTTDTAAAPGYGGNDVITGGDGNKAILGGMGSDRITAGLGRSIIFGDNGRILYAGAAGNLKPVLAVSTEPGSGGDDIIIAGNGNKHVIGGYGADTVTTAAGDDILIGDNGEIQYESGIPSIVRSINPTDGGNDLLRSGSGVDILIGGTANDEAYGGEDNDVLIGDGGQVTLTSGEWLYVETIDHHSGGGDDYLDSGSGEDIMLGGEISNTFVGTLGQDVMVGTYGRVTITAGKVQSLVRLDSIDLITNTMTSLEDGTNAESQPLWTSGAGTGGQAGTGGTEGGGATGGTGGAGFGSYFSTGSTLPGVWVATSYGTELMRLGDADLSQEDDGHSDSQAGSQGGSSGESGSGQGANAQGSDAGSGQESTGQEGEGGQTSGEGSSGEAGSGQQAGDGATGEQGVQGRGGEGGGPQAGAGDDGSAVLGEDGTDIARTVDMGAGAAMAGFLGWKVISGGDLGKGGLIDRQSFKELKERQEKKRFKSWRNAGSWK